jgi:RNA polymerase sigma factor for flagellar operon FliA
MDTSTTNVRCELDHKQKEINFTDLDITQEELLDDDSDSYEKAIKAELYQQLDMALSNILPRQAEILRLRFYDNLTRKEISIIMGVTPARIGQIEHQAIRNLKKANKDKDLEDLFR